MISKTHCWITLDKQALLANYRMFCEKVGHARLAPVLKGNAYGHGLQPIYEILSVQSESLPAWICVNYLYEAEALRQWGYQGRVLIVGPLLSEELSHAAALKVEVTLGHPELLQAWLGLKMKPFLHLKINTGMSRQGFNPEQLPGLIPSLLPHQAYVRGLSTHFANVEDVTDNHFASLQLTRLHQAAAYCRQQGLAAVMVHAASSASTLLMLESQLDLCRVGYALYGLWPSALTRLSYANLFYELAPLKPVLAWKTRLTTIRELAAGDYVGYGCTFRAPAKMRLGVVSVGYFEGYPRLAGHSRSYVLIHGKRCPILGRVCMNMMMVDLTNVHEAQLGSVVTLIGQDGEECLSAEDLASWSQTIGYEIVTRLNGDIPRLVIAGSASDSR